MRILALIGILALLVGCESPADSGNAEPVGPTGIGGKGDLFGDIEESPGADATVGLDDATETGEDPYAQAKDPTIHRVTFPDSMEIPYYEYADVDTGFSLGGTEFWQKWTGGKNPTYSYGDGSDYGKRCMYASARRFEVIMNSPPASLVELKERSNWGGSFFNWNDDYSLSDWGEGSSARLWAWRTTLIKWISQTNKDGSCFLPTLEMVEALAADCLSELKCEAGQICAEEGVCVEEDSEEDSEEPPAEDAPWCSPSTEGEIQGCSA